VPEKEDKICISGMQIYPNFVREHETLNGMTPADAYGIVVEGENRWMTMFQNVAQAK